MSKNATLQNPSEQALIEATKRNDIPALVGLLQEPSAALSTASKGLALIKAAKYGHVEAIELLFAQNIKYQDKAKAITIATQYGQTSAMLKLRDAWPDILVHFRTTPAHYCETELRELTLNSLPSIAAFNGHVDTLNALLEPSYFAISAYSLLLDIKTRLQSNPETEALYRPIIERLLQVPGVALIDAAKNGDLAAIEKMLPLCNTFDELIFDAALGEAISHGHINVTFALIHSLEADSSRPHLVNDFVHRGLDLAALNKQPDVAKELLSHYGEKISGLEKDGTMTVAAAALETHISQLTISYDNQCTAASRIDPTASSTSQNVASKRERPLI